MASYETSFVVNAADLQKILEQIKIAERHAAGENLVDIIGQDNALLPMGLRTVDGSFNHLLPGQSTVGAADEVFPRLLPPQYINEQDGDAMPLGPPGSGAPTITNTNYDPTLPGSHSVADADPRTISNLIVDQTLGNRATVQAALEQAGIANAFTVSATIVSAFEASNAARATETTFERALAHSQTAKAALDTAATQLAAVRDSILADTDTVPDQAALDGAASGLAAAQAAKAAVFLEINTLLADPTAATSPALIAAQSLLTTIQALETAADALVTGLNDGTTSGADAIAADDARDAAASLAADAGAHVTAVSDSEVTAHTATIAAATTVDDLVAANKLNVTADGSVLIEHRSADIGLSPPNSGWMTLFGQFFDHGLDLVTKGGNGTVYIPLEADDPLIAGADKVFGTADDLPPEFRFMTLTRATPFDANGNPSPTGTESQNTTTPFVDQNQTYTSSASHQVFLREYKFTVDSATDSDTIADSHAVNTGRLLNGANGGIANWKEVKAQAAEKLGLLLNDADVNDVPLLEVDPYGKFIAGPNGFAQVHLQVQVQNIATGSIIGTVPNSEFIREGEAGGLNIHAVAVPNPGSLPLLGPGLQYIVSPVGTGHAFLNDIAHDAAPVVIGGVLQADTDSDIGNAVPNDGHGHNTQYDNELLDAHFITGDGRGNENIGLTAVHTVFHSEHNRLVEANKETILRSGDLAIINEWLATDLNDLSGLPAPDADKAAFAAFASGLDWDGERLFQAARFVTEMQYQHLVFEEFARRMQPNVDPFVFTNSADLDPSIVAEFAHTVYRFGHSMLADSVDRLDNNLNVVGDADGNASNGNQQTGLIAAFLNPQMFTASGVDDEAATGAIVRGMSRQVGSEMDEFVVEALRNNLLGLPLDLAALNLARGRDQGIATLNHAREQLYAMTGAVDVKPYTSWVDFAQHMKHPVSVVNFIAAYGTHQSILDATTLADKRDAAFKLVMGDPGAPADRLDFLNATGAYAPDGAGPGDDSRGGLNNIDLWIGGLAEELNEFGGQLGSTFNFIFEYQMEHLQNGDRMYYLSRTQGMNLLNLLEPNNFSDMIMRNTDLGDLHATHLPALIMSATDMILELDKEVAQQDYSGADTSAPGYDPNPADRSLLDPTHEDPFLQAIDPKVVRIQGTARMNGLDPVLDADGKQIYDGGVLKFSGGEHVVLGGTEGNDKLIGDKGIDTLWGDGGNDYLNAGMESDQVYGGTGDDIIEDTFGDDFLRGEAGDDVIVDDLGLDLLFGGEGQDFIMGVTDTKEVFAGPGNDFVLGGSAPDVLLGNEGDDWIEGGEGFDGLSGENSELFFNSPIVGHDILNGQGNDTDYDGENGDDIMVQSAGIQRNNGMDGFDWAIHKGDTQAADSDLGIRVFDARQALILRDRFDSVEGLSGWKNDDILTGANRLLVGENFADALTQDGVNRIDGMREFLGIGAQGAAPGTEVVFESDTNTAGEIILGGDGNDTIRGNLGDDILDGDAWLNVRISVHQNKVPVGVNNQDIPATNPEIATVDSLTSRLVLKTGVVGDDLKANETTNVAWVGKSVAELMRSGDLNPGQLIAVREVLFDTTQVLNDVAGHNRDVAVFGDVRANYTIETTGLNGTGPIGDGDSDGFITVTHIPSVAGGGGGGGGGAIEDGVDKIRNFEILSFADTNIFLDPTINNTAATGLLSLSILTDTQVPGENVGDTFVVNLGTVADADNAGGLPPPITAFTFTWEFEPDPVGAPGVWEPVVDPVAGGQIFGRTFTPTPAFELDGLRLRVVGSFRDSEGIPESVRSNATAALAAQAVATATTGDDVLVGTNGPDFINALAGDDIVSALAGNDLVIGGPGNDILDGGADTGANLGDISVFFGPLANFSFVLNVDGQLEVVDAAAGVEDAVIAFETLVFIDTPMTDVAVQTLIASLRSGQAAPAGVSVFSIADLLDGTFINDPAGNDGTLTGTEFDDVIFGNDGDDVIDGLGGSDLLIGGTGDDTIDSGGGLLDIVSGGSSTAVGNTIRLRVGDETLLVGVNETGTDTVRNDGGIETISVGAVGVVDVLNQTGSVVAQPGAIATLTGVDDGAGNLVLTVNNKTVTITDHFNNPGVNDVELITFNGSSFAGVSLGTVTYNLVAAPTGTTALTGGATADALFGTAAADSLTGGDGNDLLLGDTGNDTLAGGLGADLLIGGAGADSMTGGDGDDTYEVNDSTAAGGIDVVTEAAGAASGTDTVFASVSYTLTANVENLTLTGNGNINATGNGGDNVLTGNSGNNTLNGVSGSDTAAFSGSVLGATFGLAGANVTVATQGGGTDTLQNIDNLRFGTDSYNLVSGTAANNTLNGTANADVILGFGGNDALNGGDGNDFLDGGTNNVAGGDVMTGGSGDDAYVVDDVTGNAANRDQVVETATGGNDTVMGAVSLDLGNYANVENITLIGNGNISATGNAGDNVLTGNAGNNTLSAGGGDDTIIYNVAGGRDIVVGGANGTAAGDTFVLNGNAAAETFRVYSRQAWDDIAGNNGNLLATGTEIVITRNGTNFNSIVAELDNIEEIVINTLGVTTPAGAGGGASGGDTISVIGDFTGTSLNFSTITINGSDDDDVVDVTAMTSAHHVVLNSGGGFDRFVGQRVQDEFNGAGGDTPATTGFTLTASDLAGLHTLINGGPVDDEGESEFEGPIGVRELSGIGQGVPDDQFIRLTDAHFGANGAINPLFAGLDPRNISNILGTHEADLAKSAAGSNIFFMAFGQYFDHGLDFITKGGNGKVLIDGADAFNPETGQPENFVDLTRATQVDTDANGDPVYQNQTSPFVDQNQAYGSHELVGEFLRESDGNHGFGSHLYAGAADPNAPGFRLLPTLRELIQHHVDAGTVFSTGQTLVQAYSGLIVGGAIVESVAATLASDFLGSGHNLLLDANRGVSPLDHYIAGDGRANENISLTAMHTIWARNHNFHVENLVDHGFVGSAEELFQAAKMLNEAEYQRVVFTEFADALLGGIRGDGDHGFKEHNPDADPRISHEFAAAAYRFGHSLISDTLEVVAPDGTTTDVPLVQAFLNPAQYAQLGVGNILEGIARQQAEEVDFNIVDAVRNDLVGTKADLFAFNVARGWDVGLGTLNQVRAGLAASTDPYVAEARGFAGNLSPYTSWEDFQSRNGLSDAVINQFKQAYPDLVLADADIAAFVDANPDIELVGGDTVTGIDRVEFWVGGLAEKHVLGGQVGQSFWVVLHEQFDRLQESDRFYYIDRFDNFDLYENEFESVGFAGIIERNSGLSGLPEDIFFATAFDDLDEGENDDEAGNDNDDDVDAPGDTDNDNDDTDEDGDDDVDGDDDEEDEEDEDEEDEASEDTDEGGEVAGPPGGGGYPNHVVYIGGGAADTGVGSVYDDVLVGNGGDDVLFGLAGDDNLSGGDGDDRLIGDDGDDIAIGGAGDDTLLTGAGDDTAFGDSGADTIFAGDGNDHIFGGADRDIVNGDAGDDVFHAAANDGDDAYHGGAGTDTLDLQAIMADVTVDLGGNGVGLASSCATGRDTLSGIENVIGGSGNDTIIASNAVNVLDGGDGEDTFVFNSIEAANGDTIEGFSTGDTIDLAPLYRSLNLPTGSAFSLVGDATFTAAGQVRLHVNGDDTFIEGNTDTDMQDIDFSIKIAGRANLTQNDFT